MRLDPLALARRTWDVTKNLVAKILIDLLRVDRVMTNYN